MVVKVIAVGKYNGYSITAKGSVTLKFRFMYGELVNVVNLIQMLSNDISVKVKCGIGNVKKIGMFRLKSINVEDDGESVVTLNGITDFVESGNLGEIVTDDLVKIMFVADIEDAEQPEEKES